MSSLNIDRCTYVVVRPDTSAFDLGWDLVAKLILDCLGWGLRVGFMYAGFRFGYDLLRWV